MNSRRSFDGHVERPAVTGREKTAAEEKERRTHQDIEQRHCRHISAECPTGNRIVRFQAAARSEQSRTRKLLLADSLLGSTALVGCQGSFTPTR